MKGLTVTTTLLVILSTTGFPEDPPARKPNEKPDTPGSTNVASSSSGDAAKDESIQPPRTFQLSRLLAARSPQGGHSDLHSKRIRSQRSTEGLFRPFSPPPLPPSQSSRGTASPPSGSKASSPNRKFFISFLHGGTPPTLEVPESSTYSPDYFVIRSQSAVFHSANFASKWDTAPVPLRPGVVGRNHGEGAKWAWVELDDGRVGLMRKEDLSLARGDQVEAFLDAESASIRATQQRNSIDVELVNEPGPSPLESHADSMSQFLPSTPPTRVPVLAPAPAKTPEGPMAPAP